MNTKQFGCLLAFVVAAPFTLSAQIETVTNWTTGTFNTNDGWIRNDALAYQTNGQPETGQNYDDPVADQWYTDDPYNAGLSNGATSVLKLLPGWTLGTLGAGNNSVLFGGYGLADAINPGTAAPSLYRAFDLLPLTESVTFNADFGLIASTGLAPNKDRFGFNLLDSSGTVSLAKFVFDPVFGADANKLGVLWIANGVTNDLADISYGALYRFSVTLQGGTFDLTMASLATQTNGVGVVTNYLVTNPVLLVSGGGIAGGQTALDFGTAAVNWELSSGLAADAGSNYMILNNAMVLSTVIPEPGTWAVAALLLGGLATRMWRRSRKFSVAHSGV